MWNPPGQNIFDFPHPRRDGVSARQRPSCVGLPTCFCCCSIQSWVFTPAANWTRRCKARHVAEAARLSAESFVVSGPDTVRQSEVGEIKTGADRELKKKWPYRPSGIGWGRNEHVGIVCPGTQAVGAAQSDTSDCRLDAAITAVKTFAIWKHFAGVLRFGDADRKSLHASVRHVILFIADLGQLNLSNLMCALWSWCFFISPPF